METEVKTEEENHTDDNNTDEIKTIQITEDELSSKIDSAISKVANERDKYKNKYTDLNSKLDEVSNKLKEYENKDLSEKERQKKEQEEIQKKMADREKALQEKEIELAKRDYLEEKGVPLGLKKVIHVSDIDSVNETIDNFMEVFDEAVSAKVEQIKKEYYNGINDNTPKSGDQDDTSENPFITGNRTLQYRLYRSDREKYERLKKMAEKSK